MGCRLSRVRQEKQYLAVQALNRGKGYPIAALCRIIGLNRSSYYKWINRDPGAQQEADKQLIHCLQVLHEESRGIYGYRRMQINLQRRFNILCNKKRIRRVMAAIGMKSVIRKKRPRYVRSTPEVTAENILNRQFYANKTNEKWLTDITELKYGKGEKMYLSAILDLKDKSIVSYKISKRNDLQLVYDTFYAALKEYPNAKPLFHSDRGFQYTNRNFRAMLDRQGMKQSMSRVGRCIDNGPMEAFWGTLKAEMYYLHSFPTYSSLEEAIEEYIDFYNHHRYQLGLGGLAPMEYRAQNPEEAA